MTFTLLPALDIAGGLAAGVDPLATALRWQADGAEWIHLVDLDAAYGRASNATLLTMVVGALDIKVELSAGIVDDASLDLALRVGADRLIVSTGALDDPEWCAQTIAAHGEHVVVAVDVQLIDSGGYRLAARGGGGNDAELGETLGWLDEAGCRRYIVTDVSRDGMLSGPNLSLYESVMAATKAPVIASGGVANLDDLAALAAVGVEGAIIGKALHTGDIRLPSALDLARAS